MLVLGANIPSKIVYTAPKIEDVSIPHVVAENPVEAILTISSPTPTKDALKLYAKLMADKYKVSFYDMSVTIDGESDWQPDVCGDSGASCGISQIHKPSHPDITDEQRLDPYFSIEFMAQEFARGNGWKWTCYRARVDGTLPIEKCPW